MFMVCSGGSCMTRLLGQSTWEASDSPEVPQIAWGHLQFPDICLYHPAMGQKSSCSPGAWKTWVCVSLLSTSLMLWYWEIQTAWSGSASSDMRCLMALCICGSACILHAQAWSVVHGR